MPRVIIADEVTFVTNDKRAQYARLVVYNHGIKLGFYKKDITPTSVTDANLKRAWEDLVKGNYLEGQDGVGYISQMSRNGADHAEVARRGLTHAYAQEVRPFIRKGLLAPTFGRRRKAPVTPESDPVKQAKKIVAKAETTARKKKKAPAATKPRAKSTKMAEAVIKHNKSRV